MALPALPSNPASSLPSDLNDDNDHFAHYYSMNISLPTYANSLDLQSIAITLFEWNFGRVAHGFRMKK